MNNLPVHYRIEETLEEDCNGIFVNLYVRKYVAIRETPCTYLVMAEHDHHYAGVLGKEWTAKHTKRVSKTSRKRLCYPTLAEALESFKRRKQRQLSHLEYRTCLAKQALQAMESGAVTADNCAGFNCGYPEYLQGQVLL